MSKEAYQHTLHTRDIRAKLAKESSISNQPALRYALFEILSALDAVSKRLERFENAELETEG